MKEFTPSKKTNRWRFGIKKSIITRWDNEPYLIRWTLFSCKLFSIKLHKILASDDACLHDHPWAFISFILRGGYVEQSYKIENNFVDREKTVSRIYHPGNILYRRALYTHRLEVFQPCWTLVFTSRYLRQWGFYTPRGWQIWWRYKQEDRCD